MVSVDEFGQVILTMKFETLFVYFAFLLLLNGLQASPNILLPILQTVISDFGFSLD